MSRLPALFIQINDAAGAPVSGGKLHTYITGTTTDKTTYSDAAKTAANANPVVAGADGIVGPIYMIDEEAYTFVEKNASDVTLRTQNGVFSSLLTSDSLVTRVRQIASNPIDYGAIGDGAADESSEVQSAIDAASGVVDLMGLTFLCDSQIVLTAGLTLRNGTLDFTNCSDDECIKVHGTLGAQNLLTGDAAFGDGLVAVTSADGLAAGDLINIRSTAGYIDDLTDRGELAEIESISTLDVNIHGMVQDDYAVGSTSGIFKVSPIADVRLENLVIIGPGSIGGDTNIISLLATRRARLSNIVITKADNFGILVAGCYDTVIEGCSISDGGTYGIRVSDATTYTKIRDCVFTGVLQPIRIGQTQRLKAPAGYGVPRHTVVSDCYITWGGANASALIHVESNAQFVTLKGLEINTNNTNGSAPVILVGCADAEIVDCNIRRDGTGTPDAISLPYQGPVRSTSRGYSVRVRNNTILTDGTCVSYDGVATTGGQSVLDRLEISGNNLVDRSGNGDIQVNAGNSATHPAIDECLLSGNVAPGQITITSGHASATIARLKMSDNASESIAITGTSQSISVVSVNGCDVNALTTTKGVDVEDVNELRMGNMNVRGDASLATGIEVNDVDSVHINGCSMPVVSAVGIKISEATEISVAGVIIDGFATDRGIWIVNATNPFNFCNVNGCVITGGGANGLINIQASEAVTRSTNMSIAGNTLDSGAFTILTQTCYIDRFSISGNILRRDDVADFNVQIAGGAAGGMTSGVIGGNSIIGGSVGVSASNITNVLDSGNAYVGNTTAWNGLSNATYTITNVTEDRDYNADASSADINADVIATVLDDLEIIGLFKRS